MTINLLYVHNDSQYEKNIAFIEERRVKVYCADTIDDAYALFQHHSIHILLIDLTLKEGSGISFIKSLRKKGIMTPAIITIANLDESNLLEAINLNITQCLIRPYLEKDLCNALQIATKKSAICHPLTYTDLNFGYTYDPISKRITTSEGETIKLCNKESLLIELLLQNGDHITSYEMIENIVWEDSFMTVESLRTLIRGIRKKTHKDIITNHNGIGYKISVNA